MDTHKSDTDTDIGGNHPLRRDPPPHPPPSDSHNGTHGTQLIQLQLQYLLIVNC